MKIGEITYEPVSGSFTTKLALDPFVCDPVTSTEAVDGQFSTVPNGTMLTRPDYPLQGNRIDALPYQSTFVDLNNPPWSAKATIIAGLGQPGRPCGWWEYREGSFPGTMIDQVGEREAANAARKFTNAEKQFVKDMAATKAKASLRRGLMNMPLVIAERAQTIRMGAERVGDLARIANAIQRRDVSEFRRLKSARSRKAFAQKAASTHLEVIFGWLPLLGELEGLYDFAMEEQYDFRIGRGRHRIDVPGKARNSTIKKARLGYWQSQRRYRSSLSARCSLRADVTGRLGENAQRLGFNPLYSLYDLTPMSFISGWFSNFNFFVQSLDPLIGANFRTGSINLRTESRVDLRVVGLSEQGVGGGRTYRCVGYGDSHGVTREDHRTTLSSEPESSFSFYNNLSAHSILAGASLYLQRRLKPLNAAIAMKPFRYKSPKRITLPPLTYKRT